MERKGGGNGIIYSESSTGSRIKDSNPIDKFVPFAKSRQNMQEVRSFNTNAFAASKDNMTLSTGISKFKNKHLILSAVDQEGIKPD